MASAQPTPAVESPSLSSSSALARFEYEAGRTTNDATKVLMVEWEDDEHTRRANAQWHISWKDSESVLPAGLPAAGPDAVASPSSPATSRSDQASDIHRLFFLLPPGTAIPPTVTLRNVPADPSLDTIQWKTNPLPAIFPPELGASAREAGKKGVLHTLWAKKRLAVLQAEIGAEYSNNFEGIGLEMALQEKEWIETNFGVSAKRAQAPTALHIPTAGEFARENAHGPPSPTSPRSPGGGGRLLEKLKGLRLGTNERDWSPQSNNGIATPPQTADNLNYNPLSPLSGDIAVSSFAAIKGTARDSPPKPAPAPRRVMVAQAPPAELLAQQEHVSFGMASLGGMAAGQDPARAAAQSDEEEEDGLFALPMSPRSPEMAKSPFSFDAKDTQKYKELAATS